MIEITSDYLASQGLSPTFADRFWEKVFIVPYDRGCWIWGASTYGGGYGKLYRGPKIGGLIGAHVASWIMHFGPVPNGLCVLHHCDNPPCCNPYHLFLGNHKTNSDDKMQKGRFKPNGIKSEDLAWAILKPQDVILIRKLYATGKFTAPVLAARYGISPNTIYAVTGRHSWKHI